jgi:uncharacterized membrane protein YqjE
MIMEEREPSPPGFLDSLRGLGANLLGTAHDRIQLFTIELHEEKVRLLQLLIWIGAIGFSAVMAMTFLTVTVVYLFWETARLPVLIGFAVFYGATFTGIAFAFRRYLKRQPLPFDATLQELREDRECMRNEN